MISAGKEAARGLFPFEFFAMKFERRARIFQCLALGYAIFPHAYEYSRGIPGMLRRT